MSAPSVILYDLPSKDGNHCWSLNPWKTRLFLNYKEIDYKTEWVEYPDIEPKFKAVGIPPNAEGTAYTIPTIYIPSQDKYIMDSMSIADHLSQLHPTPSLKIHTNLLTNKVQPTLTSAQTALRPVFMPTVPKVLLNDASLEFWYRTRSARVGMPLDEWGAKEGGEKAFDAARGPMGELAEILKESGGPFVEGEEVTYADFVILGWLRMLERLGGGEYEKATNVNSEPFAKLMKAGRKWLERDDH